MTKTSRKKRKIKVPGPKASDDELADFFEKHDTIEFLEQGIMEVDPDHSDIEAMLPEYRKQPNSQQLNIRFPRESGVALTWHATAGSTQLRGDDSEKATSYVGLSTQFPGLNRFALLRPDNPETVRFHAPEIGHVASR